MTENSDPAPRRARLYEVLCWLAFACRTSAKHQLLVNPLYLRLFSGFLMRLFLARRFLKRPSASQLKEMVTHCDVILLPELESIGHLLLEIDPDPTRRGQCHKLVVALTVVIQAQRRIAEEFQELSRMEKGARWRWVQEFNEDLSTMKHAAEALRPEMWRAEAWAERNLILCMKLAQTRKDQLHRARAVALGLTEEQVRLLYPPRWEEAPPAE